MTALSPMSGIKKLSNKLDLELVHMNYEDALNTLLNIYPDIEVKHYPCFKVNSSTVLSKRVYRNLLSQQGLV